MNKPRILIFASGSAEGGGSGFENLIHASRKDILRAEIVAVVSNHANGGVKNRAEKLDIPFIHFPKPWTAEKYQEIANSSQADFFALSGWLKFVSGLDPETRFNSRTVFNIHPGPLPQFGGPGMYGHHVHEAVTGAFERGELTHSSVCMHFVTEAGYDDGPTFFRLNVEIQKGRNDTPETLAACINPCEHRYQPEITNKLVNGLIRWDGINPDSLTYPDDYVIERFI